MAKIDKQSTSQAVLKNTGIIAIGNLSTKLIAFLLMPLYTALLRAEEYGLFDLLGTYSGLISVLVGMQLYQGLFRFIVPNRNDKVKVSMVVSTAWFSSVVGLMIYAVVFVLVSPRITLSYKWYLLLSVIIHVFYQLAANTVRGLGNNRAYAFASFLSAAISIVLNVVGIALLKLGVIAMLFATILGTFVGLEYLIIRCGLFAYISRNRFSRQELKAIISYSTPLIPNELSWSVIHASDRMVVSYMLSVAANGLVAVASRFSTIYTTVFSFFNASWTEQVVLHYKDEGGKEYINEMFDKMITFFAMVAVEIIAVMPFVFKIMVDEAYTEAYGLIPIYILAVSFNAVVGLVSSIYLVHRETGRVAMSTAAAATINLVTDLLLINYIGIYAAPVSSLLGYLTIAVWRLVDVNRRHCRITMSLKKLFIILVALYISLITYYVLNWVAQIIGVVICTVIAVILNKKMMGDLLKMLPLKRRKTHRLDWDK